MAKFGVDATSLSSPDIKGASHISEGIIDRSAGYEIAGQTNLITNLGTTGKDAYTGYSVAEYEEEQSSLIDEYISKRDNDTTAQTALAEAVTYDSNRASLFLNGASEEEVNPVTIKFNESVARYKKAMDAGVMSPEEFSTRTTATLRSAINKNPFLIQELSTRAKQVLDLSGITDVVATDKLLQKQKVEQQDKYVTDLRTRAKSANVSYTASTPVYELEQAVAREEGDKRAFDLWKRGNEQKEVYTKEEGLKWVESNGDSAVRGGLATFGNTLLALGTDAEGNTIPFSQIKAQATVQAQLNKDAFLQAIPVEYRQNPAVLQKIESFNKGVDSSLAMLETLGSGEDWKKQVTNHLDITKIFQEQNVVDKYDVASLDLAMNLMKADPSRLIYSDKEREAVRNLGTSLAAGDYKAPIIDKNMPKNNNDTSLSKWISNAAVLGKERGNYEGLDKILDTYNAKSLEMADPAQKQLFLHKNLEAISKSDLTGATITTVDRVGSMVTSYLEDPVYGLPSMFSNIEKYKATLDVLPDGRAVFIGNEASAFNDRYAVKLNTALEAYARVRNISTKEAAKTFYPEYLGKHVNKFETTSSSTKVSPSSFIKPTGKEIPNSGTDYIPGFSDIRTLNISPSDNEETILAKYKELKKQQPEKDIYKDVSARGIADVVGGGDIYDWLTKEVTPAAGKSLLNSISKADEILFSAWRDLVSEGLLSEKQYRDRVRKKMGLEK